MNTMSQRASMAVAWAASGLAELRLDRDEGQTLVEYGLILALIALVVIGVVAILGNTISGVFSNVSSAI